MSDWLGAVPTAILVVTFLTTVAVSLGLGAQRGRVKRLESSNDDLRKEVEDEKRRRSTVESDLAAERLRGDACQRQIDELTANQVAMQKVIDGATGPLALLRAEVDRQAEIITAHHAEAMSGFDYMYALQIDAMRLMGDTRNPARIRAELRAKERAADVTDS